MKHIDSFTTALHYANHLGFAGSGPIAARQHNLCDVTDGLERAAGGYPYKVRFTRSADAPRFPYLGEFTVMGANGVKVRVRPGR